MKKINFDKIKKIHFIGIGGIGISAIAKLMLIQGKTVRGSDLGESGITSQLKEMGAEIFIGQKKENVAGDTDLVIYTPAVSEDNPEFLAAKKFKIPLISYPEALRILLNDKFGIAVCGTHGKSTTTSMTGLVLEAGGLDPNVVVGSKVPEFGGNLRIGKGRHFVAEACEYKRDFLEYFPRIIVLNNIELDHTDYYKDIEDYTSAFTEFINHLSSDGLLIYNGDDKKIPNYKTQIANKLQNPNYKIQTKLNLLSFGFNEGNDVLGYDIKTEAGKTKFKVNFRGNDLGEFELKLPGKFNVYNALAATAVGLNFGIDIEKIKKALAGFGGIWRRFEIKKKYKGATVISDYAHHPTAVKVTLEAARQFYPGKRIIAVFQPHQHNRTKILYKDFLNSFDSADVLILVEIFDVAGREEKKDQDVSSQKLAEDVKKRIKELSGNVIASDPSSRRRAKQSLASQARTEIASSPLKVAPRNDNAKDYLHPENIFYAKSIEDAEKMIEQKTQKDDVILIMGAGDIYKVADKLSG